MPLLQNTVFSLLISVVLLVTVAFAVFFRFKQNQKTATAEWVGGEISWPKAFWLSYAIGAWFFLPFVFFFHPLIDYSVKVVLAIHLISWWIRGPLELVMIYRWFNWTPVYGISHDAIHQIAIVIGLVWAASQLGDPTLFTHLSWNTLAITFLLSIVFSLAAEMVFAALFFATRGEGQEKIYFASDDPRYRVINGFTLAATLIVYSSWIALLLASFFA